MPKKQMTSTAFRKELKAKMPGYKWTVHLDRFPSLRDGNCFLTATGTQSAGSTRTSTLSVTYNDRRGVQYTVKSSGFGLKADWLGERTNKTLLSALRDLQNYYEHTAGEYSLHARDLDSARKITVGG